MYLHKIPYIFIFNPHAVPFYCVILLCTLGSDSAGLCVVDASVVEEFRGATRALWYIPIFFQRPFRDVDTSRDGLTGLRRLRRDIVAEVAVIVYVHCLFLAALHRRGVVVRCPQVPAK